MIEAFPIFRTGELLEAEYGSGVKKCLVKGIPISEIQGMTTQVAQLVAAVNKLTGRAEEKEASDAIGENHDEVASEKRMQVYSKLDISIPFPKVQIDFNAFDLLIFEPIKPILDLDTAVWMSAHTHILDSPFSIEYIDIPYVVSELCADFDIIPVDDSFTVGVHLATDLIDASEVIFEEPIQVDFKFELPICLVNKDAMYDDPLMHVDFEFSECSAELNEKEVAYTHDTKEVITVQ
ncbi:hypothetical protein LR48_Vigan08g052500 [Vigna angularis]|uniref:Uncharacterized protein n=1 Tax=Phaseolus angularis TaxID=3914 RepID=A0A0L9V3U2_PHAAN|nr:hypothetical protein LR48_Vigan08g052500 [Vigna angularis]